MGLEQYDPYAIKSYSFTVRKTNSFFSLPTVLLSILIVGLSIAINLNTVRNLWIPLNELEITSLRSLQIPEALTSTLYCAKPSNSSNKNRISVFKKDKSQLLFPFVTEEQVKLNYPQLAAQIGSGFGCVELAGLTFTSGNEPIFFEVQDSNVTTYIQSNSLDAILKGKTEPALVDQTTNTFLQAKKTDLRVLKVTKQDRLYLNYDPEVINTVHASTFTGAGYQPHPFTANYSYFAMKPYAPIVYGVYLTDVYNLEQIKFIRKNIGQILGAVLSWASILVIIIGFIAAPLMDHMLNLRTTESLFHLEPHLHNPSLLKFIFANFKSGVFLKEDRYVQMCEQIDKMKDVGTIVKLQMLLSRLVPRSRRKKTQELISSEHSFNQVIKSQVGVGLYSDKGSRQPLKIDVSSDQKPENCLTTLRKKILYFFDAGSDTVSISYRKKGIGSKRSLFITIIAVVGLFSFMIIFGLLKANSSVSRYSSIQTEQTITFPAYTIFLTTVTNNTRPALRLMDGNYTTLQNLTFDSSPICNQHLSAAEVTYLLTQSSTSNIICNPKPITLVISKDLSACRYINVDQLNSVSNTQYALYVTGRKTIPSYQSMGIFIYQSPTVSTQYRQMPIIKINYQSQNQQIQTYQLGSPTVKANVFNGLRGQLIKISSSSFTIKQVNADFFDAIQNIWTFTVILFTVIVMKLTKYVNLQEKQESRTAEKAQFRDSICIFLAKIDGLLHGRHRSQLQTLKHYTKQQMPAQ